MLSVPAEEAFSTLSNALVGQPELEGAVRDRWRIRVRGSASTQHDIVLPEALRTAADLLSRELPLQTHSAADIAALGQRFATPSGALLLLWCYASTWRKDIELAKLLGIARAVPGFEERVATVAADRVIEGPLLDALLCATLLGTGAARRIANQLFEGIVRRP